MAGETTSIATDFKIRVSDPTALGVFGLSIVTLVASSQKMGWTEGTAFIIPWAVMLGSLAQIWAAKMDFQNNNYFGSIVLGAYGLFWMAISIHWFILNWFPDIGPEPAIAAHQLGFAYIGYLIFSLFIMVAAWEANKVFGAIITVICVLFISLALAAFGVGGHAFSTVAAWSEFIISMLGFYACGAIFLNGFFGRPVLRLGKPLGLIKKAPAK